MKGKFFLKKERLLRRQKSEEWTQNSVHNQNILGRFAREIKTVVFVGTYWDGNIFEEIREHVYISGW